MRISKLVGPRPVAIITSISKEGKPNAMTASFISPISFSPPLLCVAISPKRYTWQLLQEVKEFGVCMLSEKQIEIALACGSYSGRSINKFEKFGLEIVKPRKIKPPLVKAPVMLECKLIDAKLYGDHYLVIGEVVEAHVSEESYKPLLHWSGDEFPRIC